MEIKVVSLNIWHGNLLPDVLRFLKEQNADIILLQEVYNGQDPSLPDKYRSMEILHKELGYEHEAYAPAMIDKVEVGGVIGGNVILSKFPVTATDITFFNEPFRERDAYNPAEFPTAPRNLQHAAIDADGRELHVFNLQGVWDLDGDNFSERRQKMSRVMLDGVKGKKNVILGGDTNARPTNQAMRALEQEGGLVNVFGTELTTTFNMKHKDNPGYATSVVDLIYVSPEIEIIDKDCPDVDISDHLPLIVTLRIP